MRFGTYKKFCLFKYLLRTYLVCEVSFIIGDKFNTFVFDLIFLRIKNSKT